MKKFLALLLAAVMVLGLCGCVQEDVRGDIYDGETESEPEFSLGKTSNNIYKNDFLGLSCSLPSDWQFYSDEQILELNNITAEYIDDEVLEKIQNANLIYDMYATHPTSGSNMNLILEKVSPLKIATLDLKTSLESQIDVIKQNFENMGYTNLTVKYQKITVDGKEYDGLVLYAEIQGVSFYEKVFAFKKGSYVVNVTVGTLANDETDKVLGYFDFE